LAFGYREIKKQKSNNELSDFYKEQRSKSKGETEQRGSKQRETKG
jgi:hypothetical protein